MDTVDHYLGQRLSLKNRTCTVRYIGPVADKAGQWLGVEWDDPTRGKHNGEHAGRKYFECKSCSQTAASFLRPSQPWDEPRTFLQALRAKYVEGGKNLPTEVVYISGKQAEEVGFDKFARRQAALRGIHVLVLDRMRIQHRPIPKGDELDDRDNISAVCASITDLDISYNLFETTDEIVDLCSRLPKLRSLTLDGNRFTISNQSTPKALGDVRSVGLSNNYLSCTELIDTVLRHFPGVQTIEATGNEWQNTTTDGERSLPNVQTLDLSSNSFTCLSNSSGLVTVDTRTILLKHNIIDMVANDNRDARNPCFANIEEIDLSHNNITSLAFFDALHCGFPSLRHLRVAGNPVYKTLKSAEGKPLTAEDGYMLTIARLPNLEMLNFSKISEKERLNAESYYLKQIAFEIASVSEDRIGDITARHPRWQPLCEEYGTPQITREADKGAENPNSIAARLVNVSFQSRIDDKVQSWVEDLPKSLSIYSVLGMLGKRLGTKPLNMCLIWETGERDPIGHSGLGYAGPDWWDSDDSDEDMEEDESSKKAEWVQREVELLPGTRSLGTYVEGRQARIRIEARA